MDLGAPTSYLTLEHGTAVYSSDGERIGAVEHVLADAGADVFDGLILDTRAGPGGWRFVDATQVAALHERGVQLRLTGQEAASLPEPAESPATMATTPDDVVPDNLGNKLRRAWDWLSGRY
jgi:hypothetical protein